MKIAKSLGLEKLAGSLRRHQEAIRNTLQAVPTHFLPEQCFVPFRAAERRRKSFRTDKSREVYLLAQTYHAINPLLIRAHTE